MILAISNVQSHQWSNVAMETEYDAVLFLIDSRLIGLIGVCRVGTGGSVGTRA